MTAPRIIPAALRRPFRPDDPAACFWCGWPGAELELGPPVHVCDPTCAAELEAFVLAEERARMGAGAPCQGEPPAPPDNPASST